ncbi:hypothetical protein ACIQ6K_40410 [Streptomyces sp. NPDC096354]|uniref:hypothetical protein n=1 Tax=Streptomyces sp. NPDC096354 TaxID=3366088 RepID=UPI0037FA1771
MESRRLLVAGLLSGTLLPAIPAAAMHGAAPSDFNGDGYRDTVLPARGAAVPGSGGQCGRRDVRA